MGASERTIARLTRALASHDVGDLRPAVEQQIKNGVSQQVASSLIALVEALPMTEAAKAAQDHKVRTPGFYEHPVDGRTVKVQLSRNGGHPYAMDLVAGRWKFDRGLVTELDANRQVDDPHQTNDSLALARLVRETRKRNAS